MCESVKLDGDVLALQGWLNRECFYSSSGQVKLRESVGRVLGKLAAAEAIVDELPKCRRCDEHGKRVQDVPVVPGMVVWYCGGRGIGYRVQGVELNDIVRLCGTSGCGSNGLHATLEAAEAAEAAGGK